MKDLQEGEALSRLIDDGTAALHLAERVIKEKQVLIDGYKEITHLISDGKGLSHEILCDIINRTMDKHNKI